MIAIGEQSFIVSGLDSWKVDDDASVVSEPRLSARLGVADFRLPPAASPPSGDGVRVRRFPAIYSCRGCHKLQQWGKFASPPNRSRCPECLVDLTPSRFVVACGDGHLDDFPYWMWVHSRSEPSTATGHRLSLHTDRRTASLRGVVIRCTCGKQASMEGAFSGMALGKIGIRCAGRRPWLGAAAPVEQCNRVPRTLQRGSSAAWFPRMRSALSIPPWDGPLQRLLDRHFPMFRDESDAEIEKYALKLGLLDRLKDDTYTIRDLILAVREREDLSRLDGTVEMDASTGHEASSRLRQEEYAKLIRTTPEDPNHIRFVCVPPKADETAAPVPAIEQVMLVKRLREVRVLEGFTRVEMPMPTDTAARRGALSLKPMAWLPAIEVIGEGVFLRLDQARVSAWENLPGTRHRSRLIRANHSLQLRDRSRDPVAESQITARFILLHTLAHVLINEWSLDAGYPAAALRERLYVSPEMAGVLIYTATSDSAGSLGGIIGQGEPAKLARSIVSALRRVSWCSADPLCMESEASGTDSLNLAACHACVLLPETSCETNNSFLDRAALIGTPDGTAPGLYEFIGQDSSVTA
ncbi:DrmB family protein [Embleya sp. NPDC059259]|uniref:DrmB family protein n=1 Tax=unclassified Embleya TaxID=2699296 RepID=UPI00368B5BBF